ncbi:MAG: hypothetical protein BAJALOKI1v1_1140013 [Promethearchaeota archaeon]|nr:MAG: hypothetical protein BAJALOKI1v1_1140013 [Candidatus Lokiarchaeota archaeon]
MGDWKDLYSEVKKRKMEALNKKEIVEAVEKHGKILAIEGQYEKPKKVIRHMYASEKVFIKKNDISKELPDLELDQFDVVLIGCPGKEIPKSVHPNIKEYVLQGGWLITTDWALLFIIETVFPSYIRWNRKRTDDVVISCQITKPNHPFLDGVVGEISQNKWTSKTSEKNEFRWWLENRSYPIELLNVNEVHVLIKSNELKKRWGNAPVLVYFDFGKNNGRIIHFISHTHLQKGGRKGKYTSALILTNILDEKISQKMGIQKTTSITPPTSPYMSQWDATGRRLPHIQRNNSKIPLERKWISPDPQDDYVTPNTSSDSSSVGLTSTSQIIELPSTDPSINNTQQCIYCGYQFGEETKRIYKCKECGALYHENCINLQVNEGTCKKCNRILLW